MTWFSGRCPEYSSRTEEEIITYFIYYFYEIYILQWGPAPKYRKIIVVNTLISLYPHNNTMKNMCFLFCINSGQCHRFSLSETEASDLSTPPNTEYPWRHVILILLFFRGYKDWLFKISMKHSWVQSTFSDLVHICFISSPTTNLWLCFLIENNYSEGYMAGWDRISFSFDLRN